MTKNLFLTILREYLVVLLTYLEAVNDMHILRVDALRRLGSCKILTQISKRIYQREFISIRLYSEVFSEKYRTIIAGTEPSP